MAKKPRPFLRPAMEKALETTGGKIIRDDIMEMWLKQLTLKPLPLSSGSIFVSPPRPSPRFGDMVGHRGGVYMVIVAPEASKGVRVVDRNGQELGIAFDEITIL